MEDIMSLLIINADDFGYSTGINYGIIHAFQRGVLSSTTMMANMPGFDEGVILAKENPELGIGVHLALTCGRPLRSDVKTLIDERGNFRHLSFYEKKFEIDTDELYQEWKEQIGKVMQSGIEPTHLDSHHHVNSLPLISEVFNQLAREYQLPVRNNFSVPEDITTTNRFTTSLDTIGGVREIWKAMEIRNIIEDCKNFETVEAMCHPGYVDNILIQNSSLREYRAVIAAELQRKDFAEILEKNDISLGTYNDL
jgi:hypothetical protein